MVFEREKFKRLVHYVVAQAGSKPGFGAIKLNKVLWFADARQFMLTGKPITGAEYIREKYGPVPRAIMAVRAELEREGHIKIYEPKAEYEGWRFRSLNQPQMSGFSDEELKNVDWWIRYISDEHTATSISDESHDYGWELARLGETLPLHAFLAERMRESTPEELAWAKSALKRK